MEIDDQNRYEELGEAWRHFVLWRDKLFAGYLTVLGALGYVVLQNASPVRRSVLFGAGILLSVVFWVLEFRTRQIVNACQVAAHRLEKGGGGCYTTMNTVRSESNRWLTYGFGISLLTGSVIGTCVAGLLRYVPPTLQLDPIAILPSLGLGALTGLLVVGYLERLGEKQRSRDLKQINEAKVVSQKTDSAA